ncbi:phage tail tube protein [Ferrimonas aestuarii]|uniref:Uncharacterized protein n=1 Tax=Ferrimonas aestuarii TaxID=2569539 RepID=A0A4U1BL71_9GAMM|nr:phage tail tube protein [Ferrimonas aestuarii]TKB53304.1 hypothetical protein FCL42_14635 [Ferrimonas aestuarii]
MLVKRELILLGLQAALGNPVTLDPAQDAILVESLNVTPTNQRMVERSVIKPTLGKEASVFAGCLWQVTFTAELKGSGTAGVAPEIGKALQACGLSETVVANTSATYQPASDNLALATIECYQDGNLIKLQDVRGTVSFDFTAGAYGKASFTLTGHQGGDLTAAALPNASYDSTVPVPLIGLSTLSVGGFDAEINQLTLDVANEVVTPSSIRSANGYGEVRIASRDPNGSIDPEDTVVTTKNWVKEWQDGTTLSITTGTVGGVDGNKFALTLPKCTWRDAQPGDRDGVRTKAMTFGAAETSGDDQFTLVFT